MFHTTASGECTERGSYRVIHPCLPLPALPMWFPENLLSPRYTLPMWSTSLLAENLPYHTWYVPPPTSIYILCQKPSQIPLDWSPNCWKVSLISRPVLSILPTFTQLETHPNPPDVYCLSDLLLWSWFQPPDGQSGSQETMCGEEFAERGIREEASTTVRVDGSSIFWGRGQGRDEESPSVVYHYSLMRGKVDKYKKGAALSHI